MALMGVTRKFSRGGPPFPGGGQTLARTSFIGLKPIRIKESSYSRGGGASPPRDTHVQNILDYRAMTASQ